jgi:hypothetical protein
MLATGAPASSEVLAVARRGSRYFLTRGDGSSLDDLSLSQLQRLLRHEVILAFVRAHPQLLWLHAGAVVSDDRAVLFVGQYGRGKSTLVTELCGRGWRYASDDIVPIDLATAHILPFPLTPFVRQGIDDYIPPESVGQLSKAQVSRPLSARQRDSAPIGGIVLPEYRVGVGAQAVPYSPSAVALAIASEGINRALHGEALVSLAARLVDRVPVISLHFSDSSAAADLIEGEMENRTQRHDGLVQTE